MAERSAETDADRRTGTTAATPAPEPTAPPRRSGAPLVGNTLTYVRQGIDFLDTLQEHGDVVSYRALGEEFVAVFDPDIVESVLVGRNDEFSKGDFETAFGELIAPDGVAFSEGETWRRQRQLLQSEFTPAQVQSYAETMVDETDALAADWRDGEVVELRETLSTFTLGVLTEALFDLDLDNERAGVVREATLALADIADPTTFALHSVLPSWLPSPSGRRYERAMDDLNELIERLVDERRDADDRDDLLSTLARAEYPDGERMAPNVVRDQLVTFLFAGHETTATSLTYACWLLAGHPDVRERLDAELERELGDSDPTFLDLPSLDVTEAIVNEAMRLYPPITILYREPHEALTLGGYRIPEDATLQLSAYGIHRDERWWSDPETFDPERWLADRDRPEYAYFPFGGGPRHCLGMRFAMTELQLALATLAQRVEFERVTESLDPTMSVTLDPGEVAVRVRKR
ncbi:Cytochrome P450 [Natronoarchaeum philippinense]|uniref:Cytochrome P450 n=1 Tax=Natronoarchaeum philippinense TaxID=558529 RepID=A0A285N6D1_NATPI|nr:cytochrome P450 [Natronoarchaeum philippinense]SNZ04427.1 Cytochrome P450 [Natronoarchaeum philippinense]